MGVAIKPKFNKDDITKILLDRKGIIESVILQRLTFIGEKAVKHARANGEYKDQTANLRSSIGYVVLKDGKEVSQNFARSGELKRTLKSGKNKGKVRITVGSANGLDKAREVIDEIKANYPKGYVLLIVAGMEYAAAVEAKGYDVITTAAMQAVVDLRKAVKEIKQKIVKMR